MEDPLKKKKTEMSAQLKGKKFGNCKVALHCPRKGQKDTWYMKKPDERAEGPKYRFSVLKAEGGKAPASLLFPFIIGSIAAADGAAADGAAADGAAAE